MEISIKRIYKPDDMQIKYLFEKAGMKHEKVNNKFFEDDKNILLVAFSQDNPCGFLYAYILNHINREYSEMFLYSIDVFSEFQKKGVGSLLIEELKKIAVNEGCLDMFVLTNDSNEGAKKLYEKSGGTRSNPDDIMYEYSLV